MQSQIPRFFMGTSTENGFLGFPRDLYDADPRAHAFLIKSGPGTGKSTLLRALAARFREQGETVEEFFCSSDPDSLDGIRLPARRVCVFDATAPHVIEPTAWGLKEEIVSLGDALNVNALAEKREEIEAAVAENTAAHRRARRLLGACTQMTADRHALADRALKPEKVASVAARLTLKELAAPAFSPTFCGEQRRFLSAVTPNGYVSFSETAEALCPRVIALDDPYGSAASALLAALRDAAVKRSYPRIVCPDPLEPDRLAHLLLPTVGTAFVTTCRRFCVKFPARTLHLTRLYDEVTLKANKNRTAFDKKAEQELLSAAVRSLADAKIAHDRLETPYKNAMDFQKAETVKIALYQQISAFPSAK